MAGGPVMNRQKARGAPLIHGFIVDEWETTNLNQHFS
jgi:hypothetical protein